MTVWIDNVRCVVSNHNDTEVKCVTEPSGVTLKSVVSVNVEAYGNATGVSTDILINDPQPKPLAVGSINAIKQWMLFVNSSACLYYALILLMKGRVSGFFYQ